MKTALRKRARELRRKGLSYKEIKEEVGIAKSTLSLWLKDILLAPEQRGRLYTKRIEVLCRGPKSQKERRAREVDSIIQGALREVKLPLSEEAYKLFGAALYWAEGNKGKSFEITNSDPYMIAFMVQWLKRVFNKNPSDLKARLNVYPQQDELALKIFWSELTGIPLANFGKSFVKPPSKNYKKNNLYYGTMRIYVCRGTDMKYTVYGWHKAVLQDLENTVRLVERKWISLKETRRPVNLAPIT